MYFKTINEHCYYFEGAVNIGYILCDNKGLLIDAGLEASVMKKVIKRLEVEQLPVDYLVITHAHADHYGGAAYLRKQKDIKVFAPILEAAIVENPVLEPIYLFQGTQPLSEMRNKFLEGERVQVDELIEPGNCEIGPFQLECISLPGHSYNQVGLLYKEVLYAADAYFGTDA